MTEERKPLPEQESEEVFVDISMFLRDLLRSFRKLWLIVVLLAALFASAAFLIML